LGCEWDQGSPEEDDGAVEGGGEVESGVGVALARSSLAKVANDALAVLRALEGVGRTHSCMPSSNSCQLTSAELSYNELSSADPK